MPYFRIWIVCYKINKHTEKHVSNLPNMGKKKLRSCAKNNAR